MAVRMKGSKWQVDVTVKGVRAPRISRDTKAEAQEAEKKIRYLLSTGATVAAVAAEFKDTPTPVVKGTLGGLITATYASRWRGTKGEDTAMTNAHAWADEWGLDMDVGAIGSAEITDVVDAWAANGSAAGTINRKLAALSVMLKVAMERGWIDRLPTITRRKEYEGRLRWFSDEEVESLTNYEGNSVEFRQLVALAVDTGMRQGELLGLTRRDIDAERGLVLLGETKGNKRRSVPLTDAAKAVLTNLMRGKRDHEHLFPASLTKRSISRLMGRWKQSRGLPHDDEACFHTLRHTTCSRLVQSGVPLVVVQKWMGNASIQTTMKYAHLAPDSLNVALEALNKRNAA